MTLSIKQLRRGALKKTKNVVTVSAESEELPDDSDEPSTESDDSRQSEST